MTGLPQIKKTNLPKLPNQHHMAGLPQITKINLPTLPNQHNKTGSQSQLKNANLI